MVISGPGTYYGTLQDEFKVDGLLFTEYDYHLPRTDWHYHENPYFMYVLKGSVLDTNHKLSTTCPAGSLIFHNWQEAHFNVSQSNLPRGFHIEFNRSWYERHKLDTDLWEGSQKIDDPRAHRVMAKLYSEFKTVDEFSSLSIQVLMLNLCEQVGSELSTDWKDAPLWVPQLKDMIHSGMADTTLKELADTLGVHPVHISRAVPKYFATNLGDYMRQVRLKRSLDFMLDDGLSLTAIAHLSGFSDQSHFTRTFKQYFKMNPLQFRQHFYRS